MFRTFLRQTSRAARRASQTAREAASHSGGAAYVAAAKLAQHTSASSSSLLAAAAVSLTATIALAPVAFAKTKDERSFIMIKPDGVHRGLVAEIIKRFESKGYKLVGIKVIVPTAELASQHYAEHDGKPFFPKLVDFLSSGAVVGMVWEGKDVIAYGRTMIGKTNPLASDPGTIRGDYAIDVGRNIIHGSDSVESAQREIALWFKTSELADYELHSAKWIYE